jgi:high-affinity nickel-transport protein
VVALPILFAAGMCAIDTVDGVFMAAAYGWALSTPARKLFYNLTVTGLSAAVALAIGTVELLHVLAHQLALRGSFWGTVNSLDFSSMGYAIVALFAIAWIAAAAIWRRRGVGQRRLNRA